MKNSKPFTAAIAIALLFANMVCACALSEMDAEPPAHHHANSQDDNESTPCAHQDCDGCDGLLDQCKSADYSVASVDRDAQILPPKKLELEGPDLDLAFLDTGQAWDSSPPYTGLQPHPASTHWVVGTPIIRKDQLTE